MGRMATGLLLKIKIQTDFHPLYMTYIEAIRMGLSLEVSPHARINVGKKTSEALLCGSLLEVISPFTDFYYDHIC